MPSLSYYLERIQQLNKSIQELDFADPGIFTNALIEPLPITQLLKDANANEASLYKITHQYNAEGYLNSENNSDNLIPERVDGKRYFEEDINEYLNVGNDGNNENVKRTAINVPKLTNVLPSSALSSQVNSSPTRKIVDSKKIGEIYDVFIRTMKKIPNMQENQPFLNEVNELQLEYQQVIDDIAQLEKISEDQKRQLEEYNVGDLNTSEDLQEVDLDELIRQEELEIIKTQQKLDELSNTGN